MQLWYNLFWKVLNMDVVNKNNYIKYILDKFPNFTKLYLDDEDYYKDIPYVFTFDFLYVYIEKLIYN